MLATIVIQLLCDFICLFFAVWCWRKQESFVYKKFFLVNAIAFFSLILSDAYYNILFRILHYDISESIDLMLTVTLFVFEFGQFYCWRLLSKSQNYKLISYKNSPYIVFTATMVTTLTYYFITNSNLAPFEKTYQNISIAVDMFIWLYAITCLSRTRSLSIALLSLGCLILVSSSLTICCLFLFDMEKIISAEWLHMLWTFGTLLMAIGFILCLKEKNFLFCPENSIQVKSCSLLSTASVFVSLIGFSFIFLLHLTNSDGEGIRSMLWIFPIALVFAMITSVLLGNWFSRTIFLPVNRYLRRIESFNLGHKEDDSSMYSYNTYEFDLLGKFIDDAFDKVSRALEREVRIADQVVHDIRSPLTTLEAMTRKLPELDEEKRVLLRDSIIHIRDITNNLERKSSEQSSSSQKQIVQIAVMIDQLLSERAVSFQNNQIVFKKDFHESAYGFFIFVIPSVMRRVLTNIINNSYEAMNKLGGIIEISLKRVSDDLLITISDTGPGIQGERLNSIFERGFTTKENGSGLGLHHAKESISSWEGEISVNSEENKGTHIYIKLPLRWPPEYYIERLEISLNEPIFCIDDNKSISYIWRDRFSVFNPTPNFYFFSGVQELENQLIKTSYDTGVFLVDYEFFNEEYTGIDIIKMLLSKKKNYRIFLVTSRYNEPELQDFCINNKIHLIPKMYITDIPVVLVK